MGSKCSSFFVFGSCELRFRGRKYRIWNVHFRGVLFTEQSLRGTLYHLTLEVWILKANPDWVTTSNRMILLSTHAPFRNPNTIARSALVWLCGKLLPNPSYPIDYAWASMYVPYPRCRIAASGSPTPGTGSRASSLLTHESVEMVDQLYSWW